MDENIGRREAESYRQNALFVVGRRVVSLSAFSNAVEKVLTRLVLDVRSIPGLSDLSVKMVVVDAALFLPDIVVRGDRYEILHVEAERIECQSNVLHGRSSANSQNIRERRWGSAGVDGAALEQQLLGDLERAEDDDVSTEDGSVDEVPWRKWRRMRGQLKDTPVCC